MVLNGMVTKMRARARTAAHQQCLEIECANACAKLFGMSSSVEFSFVYTMYLYRM